ncbi:hypothetical protein [Dietzia sp.]|uniref:hypothetical protein n=1 Tax=Dietzia sp. TaxID=1871616 RepID=UPI00351D4462
MPNTDLMFTVIGAALLIGSFLPRLLRERVLSAPIVVVGVGMVIGWLMPNESQLVDVIEHAELAERMAEITVIVALFGVGLALDRPLSLRGWTTTWRLLAIGMPLSIAGGAVLGWWVLGLTPAVAVLLGRCSPRPTRSWPPTCRLRVRVPGRRSTTSTTRPASPSPPRPG